MKYVGITTPECSFYWAQRDNLLVKKTDCQGDYSVPDVEGFKYKRAQGGTFSKENFRP